MLLHVNTSAIIHQSMNDIVKGDAMRSSKSLSENIEGITRGERML